MGIYFAVCGNPNLLGQNFPSFEKTCAAWYRDGRFGAVLRMDLRGRVVESFTREECDATAKRGRLLPPYPHSGLPSLSPATVPQLITMCVSVDSIPAMD
jgi:hypothetical protein